MVNNNNNFYNASRQRHVANAIDVDAISDDDDYDVTEAYHSHTYTRA
jgi:hypothetical protein